jgi:IS30 family transposase
MGTRYAQLCAEERGTIVALLSRGASQREIARVLGRSSSTISRELRRNGQRKRGARIGRPTRPYNAIEAGLRAGRLRRKARRARKLRFDSPLWAKVRELLGRRWSPREIASKLRQQHPDEPAWHVSHETIYTAIYAAPRGAIRRELVALLRQHKCARRPRGQGANRRGQLEDMVSIHVRPPEVEARLVPGHWEGDFIKGARNKSAIGVLVCRKTLLVRLARMRDCSAAAALEGFQQALAGVPAPLRQTLTYDQGKEMALHKQLTEMTGTKVFFADPHSPWQRGICENTNGLLRQYFPKGTDLSELTQDDLNAVAWEMNTRPRRSLGYHCPTEMFLRACGLDTLAQQLDDNLLHL